MGGGIRSGSHPGGGEGGGVELASEKSLGVELELAGIEEGERTESRGDAVGGHLWC